MLLSKKTQLQFETQFRSLIYENNDSLNAGPHSVVDDVIIQPGSLIFSQMHSLMYYQDLLFALDLTTIENDSQLQTDLQNIFQIDENELNTRITADVDRIAATFSLTRYSAQKATGYVRFYTNGNNPLTIPVNTSVFTPNQVEFKTIHDLVNVVPRLDSTVGLYYVNVAVECAIGGVSGNVQPRRINNLTTPIGNVVAVNNVNATTGGAAAETNIHLAGRINAKKAGRSLPTVLGYKNLIDSSGLVLDSVVKTSLDTTFVTRKDSNAVDIFVVTSEKASPARDTIDKAAAYYLETSQYVQGEEDTYPPTPVPNKVTVILNKQPVMSIVNVSVGGNDLTTSEFTLIKDTAGRSRSVRGFDKIQIDTSHNGTVIIDYEYDIGIHDSQALLNADENKVINSDALVRSGEIVLIDVELSVLVFSEYDISVVKSNVEADLEKFFAGGNSSYETLFETKLLKQRIDRSDLLNVVLNNHGVDKLKNSNFTVSYAGIPITDSLQLNDIQYARLGTVTWI